MYLCVNEDVCGDMNLRVSLPFWEYNKSLLKLASCIDLRFALG